MDFIKLTMQNRTGLGGMSIYINVSKIEAIRDEPLDRRFDHSADDSGGVVFVTGDNNAKHFVLESAETIMQMINTMKQTNCISMT